MKAYIIGSSPSGIVNIDCQNNDTYGLNRAAIDYNTKFAFSGHEEVIRTFIEKGIKNIIITFPLFEYKKNNFIYTDYIKHFQDIEIGNLIYKSDSYVEKYILHAINGDDIDYPNYMTVCHCAIHYCIKQGYKEIDLIKCHQDYDKYEGDGKLFSSNYIWEFRHTNRELFYQIPYMRFHTAKMIRIAAT